MPENPFLLEGISVFFALVGNLEINPAVAVSSCSLTAVQCPNHAGVCVCVCVRAHLCVTRTGRLYKHSMFFIKGWLYVKTLQFFYPHYQYPYTESPLFLCRSPYSFCFRFLLFYVFCLLIHLFTTSCLMLQKVMSLHVGAYVHSYTYLLQFPF